MGRFINADAFPSTGEGILGNNMFAYCGNNPVVRNDSGGEWWNIVIGAVAGAVVNAVSTALQGGTATEIALSAVCGAVSGAFAATGFGGVAGQAAVGAITSAIDSGYQNFNDYKSGEKTLAQAIGGTIVDTVMGATFGAMGAEGTDALKTSNRIAKATKQATKTLSNAVLHPKVRSAAVAVIKTGRKYFLNTVKSSFLEAISTTAVGNFASDVTEQYLSIF